MPAAAPEVQGLLETFPELARELPPVIEDQRMPPAIEDQRVPLEYMVNERFLGLEDVAELRVGEVEALLREYQGLVGVLKKAGLVG